MQVNMTAAQMTAMLQSTGLTGQTMQAAGFSGGFMELLMQLLGNTETADPSQMLMGLFGAGMPQEETEAPETELFGREELSQEQQQNAMEMLAALLQGAGPQTMPQLMEAVQENGTELTPDAVQAMPAYWAAMQDVKQPQAPKTPASAQEEIPFTVETSSQPVRPVATESSGADALLLQGRFQSAVQKAKTMSAEEQAPKEQALDVQTLEDRVQTAQKTEQTQSSRTPLDVKDLAKQLTQSVPKALQEGKSEFTLRLKPEGLGEITVKLTQEGGKTSVTIASALTQTDKLIGAQLGTLEKALEPMGVTIRQEPMQQMAAQQQGMTDQNQQFMLWQQHQQRPGKGWQIQDSEVIEEIYSEESAPSAMLDAYI